MVVSDEVRTDLLKHVNPSEGYQLVSGRPSVCLRAQGCVMLLPNVGLIPMGLVPPAERDRL